MPGYRHSPALIIGDSCPFHEASAGLDAAGRDPGTPIAHKKGESLRAEHRKNDESGMDIDAAIEMGEALFMSGLLDEAESKFREILRIHPDHHRALNNLGVISHCRGDATEAQRYFAAAIDGCDMSLDAVMNLVDLYESEGRWEEAGKCLKNAIRHVAFPSELCNRLDDLKVRMSEGNRRIKTQPDILSEGRAAESAEKGKASQRRVSVGPERTQPPPAPKLALTRSALLEIVRKVCYLPHPEIRKGTLHFPQEAFQSPDRECNLLISPGARLDLTGDLTIGPWTMIGEGTVVFTHDHYHKGRHRPLLRVQEEKGIKWHSKVIGSDVWLHGCTVLCQVSEIPDGVVVGAGAVLTKNPNPYEIWAGNPARKVGER